MFDTLRLLLPIAVAFVVILVVVVLVIKRLLLSDTMRAVNRIKQVETEVRRREEGIRKEIAEQEQEAVARKAEAEEDLLRKREEQEKEIAALRDQAVVDARKEGEAILDQARRGEAKLREQIGRDMERKSVEHGIEVFKLVFSDRVNHQVNREFIGELLDALAEIDGASITVDASEASFTSSHAMDDDQKVRLKELLADKFGVEVEVHETVDAELMAGLTFKLGSLEIDGSLRNRLEDAAAEIKKSIQI